MITENQKSPRLRIREISYDGLMPWADVYLVTGLSRPTVWRLERGGRFPARVQLSSNRVGWYGHEVRNWISSRPRVDLELCEVEKGEQN